MPEFGPVNRQSGVFTSHCKSLKRRVRVDFTDIRPLNELLQLHLTYCGLVTPYGVIDPGQQWLRLSLFAWYHQAFTWNNVDSLQWRHNDYCSVSNHQPHGCLLNRLFRRRSKKTSKLRVTGLCARNSPGPVNSPHKGPVTRKMFPFDDVIMLIINEVSWQSPGNNRKMLNTSMLDMGLKSVKSILQPKCQWVNYRKSQSKHFRDDVAL